MRDGRTPNRAPGCRRLKCPQSCRSTRDGAATKKATLEVGEKGGGEDPTDAPAVNGENAKRPSSRPGKRVASSLQGAIRPLRRSTCAIRFHSPSLRVGCRRRRSIRRSRASPHSTPASRSSRAQSSWRSTWPAAILLLEDRTDTGLTFRASRVRIVMGNRIVGRLVPPMQERIGHCDPREALVDHAAPWISSVCHTNGVGLAERPQGPRPRNKVTCALRYSEVWPGPWHGVRLDPRGQFLHRTRSSP